MTGSKRVVTAVAAGTSMPEAVPQFGEAKALRRHLRHPGAGADLDADLFEPAARRLGDTRR